MPEITKTLEVPNAREWRKWLDRWNNGEWDRGISRDDISNIPDDLLKALSKDKITQQNYENFSNSVKKQLLWWLADAKKDETRKRRIVKIVSMAKDNIKPGMV